MKLQKFLDEGPYKLVFAGFHLKDNILDEITVEELQETVYSNIPNDKINVRTVQKEFESLLRTKVNDAKFVAKKVIPELVKDLQGMVEGKNYRMIYYDSGGNRIDVVEIKANSSSDAFEQAKKKKPSNSKMVDLVVDKRSIGKYDLSKDKLG